MKSFMSVPHTTDKIKGTTKISLSINGIVIASDLWSSVMWATNSYSSELFMALVAVRWFFPSTGENIKFANTKNSICLGNSCFTSDPYDNSDNVILFDNLTFYCQRIDLLEKIKSSRQRKKYYHRSYSNWLSDCMCHALLLV